jgi:non-ribosomal peptide synthetase component F
VTPNTVIQAAWALVLAQQCQRRDIVFGAAFAGRPPELPGAGEIVGPFVNNVPVRVRLRGDLTLRDFVARLHTELLRINTHQFAPLPQIQSWSDVPWRDRLFNSLVVVQNYAVEEAARRLGRDIAIRDFVGPIHSNIPLLVLVEPGPTWTVVLVYNPGEVTTAAVERWGGDFVRLLERMPAESSASLDAVAAGLSTPLSRGVPKRTWRVKAQNHVPPQTDAERRIAQICETLLGMADLSVDQNLFDLGIHSLLVVRLHQRLQEELGRELPLVSLFQWPTIRALADQVTGPGKVDETGELRARAERQRTALSRRGRIVRR